MSDVGPKRIAEAIEFTLHSPNERDANGEAANVVDGLFCIGRALDRLATAVERLGLSNAATPMGAIEGLAKVVRDGMRHVAEAIEGVGDERP